MYLPLWARSLYCVAYNTKASEGPRLMELYINSSWTECYENACIAEAIAWSENGNHATIYTMGITPEAADAKLMGALRELHLVPETSMKTGTSEKG
jgi:hypothetical protein